MSATQFIWKNVLGFDGFAHPKRKAESESCWLCAGDAGSDAWTLKDAIGSGFTASNIAKAPHSGAVCSSCVALMSRDAWILACEKHGHSPNFPAVEGKKPSLSNWMFSSHVFIEDIKTWLRPDRAQTKEIILNPPKGRWLISLAAVGKKHVLFQAPINDGVDNFFVQLDSDTILVDRALFTEILDLFELGYNNGLSKESMLSGNYSQAAILKWGISNWRELESSLSIYRAKHYAMLQLAHYCARKTET